MYELFFLPFQINYKPLFYRPWFVIAILILVFLFAVGIPPVDSWIWTHSSDAFRGWITFLALGPGGYTLFEADGGAFADFAGVGEGSDYVLRGEEDVGHSCWPWVFGQTLTCRSVSNCRTDFPVRQALNSARCWFGAGNARFPRIGRS